MTTIPPTNIGNSTPSILDNSLVGNFNASAIIQAELQPYEIPEQNLQSEQSTLNSNVADYQQINSDLVALETAAQQLSTPTGWQAQQATSSDSSVATATAAPGTPSGSVEFIVQQLAAANSLVSTGNVSSTSQIVSSSSDFLLSTGGSQIGFSTLAAAAGLTLGAHTVDVTQASQAADATGTIALESQTAGIAVAPGADSLDVSVDGTAYSLSIADAPAGGYSGAGLLSAVQSAITAAGAGSVLQAGYNSAGQLVLSTIDQGSSQSLQITGGSALGVLGLSSMSQASTGVDGIVSVDGTSTTLSDVQPGSTVSLGAPSGQVTATVVSAPATAGGSLLQSGSVTATNVSTGNGSLADIVANINAAGTGITAAAVQTGTNQYVLQLLSSSTGTAGDLSVDMNAFGSSALGALRVATAGADAEIQVGGAGGYTLSSQNNTFTGVLPGLTINALAQSTTPVTVTVSPDATAAANNVQQLVSAANTVLSDIQKYAGYDAATKTGGPLMGSAILMNVTNEVQSIFASTEGSSTLGNSQDVGITLDNGTINFNQSAFETAYAANPSQVAAMFTQGGTFTPANPAYSGQVSLSYASSTTHVGTYDVQISQSASQATTTGSALSSGSVSAAETLTIASAGQSIQLSTSSGESLTAIAAAINSAFASAGMSISAQVVGGGQQLQLTSDAYGSAASFSVTTTNTGAGTTGLAGAGATAGTPVTFAGTDVAGTINGVTATGTGQFLTAPSTDPELAGLSLQIGVTGITSLTDLGTFTYSSGLAQSLSTLASSMSDPSSGAVTQTINSMQNQSQGLDTQIAFYANIVAAEQKTLTNQFANLQAQLGTLENQGSSLTSALSTLPTDLG
ncbi:MAG TPA: flagellar filament capping protein FliD [Acidimicrobiales bacterium]|nr:flagellar filament capping protein FliD [Acidimicrobiales bacterium]